MQKVPVMPTTPWQGGDPIFSNPTATAEAAAEGQRLYLKSLMGMGLVLPLLILPLMVF